MDTYFKDSILHSGRPLSTEGRLPRELRVYDLLDKLLIPYTRLDHDAAFTMEACHDIDRLLDIHVCKNLFLRNSQRTGFYLLMMPGEKKFRTALLSRQIGSSRLSFAEPEYMEKLLDIAPGSVSVLGLMNDRRHQVKLLIDEDVVNGHEFMGCHPCVNTSSLKLRVSDILEKFLPYTGHSYTLVRL